MMLGGHWKDYEKEEDNILKRAYMTGHKKAKYAIRGNQYEYDFNKMVQINPESGKERQIRAPHKMKPPSKPIVPSGPTMVVKVAPGTPGTQMTVPHPQNKSVSFCVDVPKNAKVGAAMIVPVPPLPADVGSGGGGGKKEDKGMSTAGKVGVGVAGAALVGGMAVTGAVIGSAADDGAFDGAIDAAGAAMGDAGDAIGDGLGDAGDWLMDVGADAGDFIMDLF